MKSLSQPGCLRWQPGCVHHPDFQEPPDMPTDVAIHEAAHAVVAAYTGRRVRHIIVNPDGTGEVEYYRPTHIIEGQPPLHS